MEFKDRSWDQEEITRFLNVILPGTKQSLNYEEYCKINNKVSSEMFFSLMSIMHERLPCANNCFRLKKIFRSK